MATEAEVERKYKQLIADAGDDETEKLRLEAEKNKEIADVFRTAARASQFEAMRREAVNKFPLAVLAEVTGDSPEELEETAKASHEKIQELVAKNTADKEAELEKLKAEVEEARAKGWAGNTAGGSGTPPPTTEEERYAFFDAAWKALRESTLSQQQASRLIQERTGDVVWNKMAKLMGVPVDQGSQS